MPDRLTVSHDTFVAERPAGADEDVHMIGSVVDAMIERFSDPHGVVCDPFAGFGTTLARATALGRHAIGVELLPERVAFISERVPEASMYEGDARELLRVLARHGDQPLASASLVLTSPPYMTAQGHDADPLTAYEEDGGDYTRYLRELHLVAGQCAVLVKPGGRVVWNVADIHTAGHTTPLISDCHRVLGAHLEHESTIEISWDRYPHDLVRDALLVFRRPTRPHSAR